MNFTANIERMCALRLANPVQRAVEAVDAAGPANVTKHGLLGDDHPVAASRQRPEPDVAAVLRHRPVIDGKPRIRMAVGEAAPRFQDLCAFG